MAEKSGRASRAALRLGTVKVLGRAPLEPGLGLDRDLLELIPVGIDLIDRDGRVLFMNQALRALFPEVSPGAVCWEAYKADAQPCPGCPFRGPKKASLKEFYETTVSCGNKLLRIIHACTNQGGEVAFLRVFQDHGLGFSNGSDARLPFDLEPAMASVKPTPRSAADSDGRTPILVVDNHPIFREGVTQLINRQPDMAVCGDAGSVGSATQILETRRPQLVLLDLRLGNSDVFELIKGWKKRFPELRILILSQYDEALYAERALRAGADGYVMKEEASEETISAIRAVLTGELYVSRKMAAGLLHKLIQSKPVVRDASVEVLSDRELHVFRMIGAGLSSRKIAEDLHLSIKTIETYRENIKHKLGLRNAAELIRLATQWMQTSAPQDVDAPPSVADQL